MCGIVGYVGNRQALPILLDSLERVTYRGYDSFGVAVLNGRGIDLFKQVGPVDEQTGTLEMAGTAGIGHTRWATVGAVSQQNAHPHTDCANEIAIVHNGDIDNFRDLRDRLIAEGHTLRSETDSELIAHLVENYAGGSLVEAVTRASEDLEGSYAAVVMDYKTKELVVTRNESPVVIGLGDGEVFVASDAPAIVGYVDRVMYPEDGDVVLAKADGSVEVYRDGAEITLPVRKLGWDSSQTGKNGYDHFMLKEIHEQPAALRDTLAIYADGMSGLPAGDVNEVVALACGTSYHAALYAEALLTADVGMNVRAQIASEYRVGSASGAGERLVIAISQSGETADTLNPVRAAKAQGTPIIGITNVPESSLARLSDTLLQTAAGPEVAVAATKTYTTQMLVLALMAAELKGDEQGISALQTEFRSLPGKIEQLLARSEHMKAAAEWLAGFENTFIIAKGRQIPVAMEAALKLKEVAYLHAEAGAAGELKHGPFALLSEKTPVIAIIPQDEHRTRMITAIREIAARGAPVMALVDGESEEIAEFATSVITVPMVAPSISPIIFTVAAQLLSYYCGIERGCPVDRPRNLAKSVTVL